MIFFEQNEDYKEDNFICLNKLKKDLENIEDKYKSQKKITSCFKKININEEN